METYRLFDFLLLNIFVASRRFSRDVKLFPNKMQKRKDVKVPLGPLSQALNRLPIANRKQKCLKEKTEENFIIVKLNKLRRKSKETEHFSQMMQLKP